MWPSWAFRPNEVYGFRGRTGLSYVNRHPRTLSHNRGGGDDIRAQELCESRGGRPGLPVPNSLHGHCGRKATLNLNLSRRDLGRLLPSIVIICTQLVIISRVYL